MIGTVNVKTYTAPKVNLDAIYRYAQCFEEDRQVKDLVSECFKELAFSYKVCYREFDVKHLDGQLDLTFCTTDSKSLKKLLENCERALLFAATVGFDVDRKITKYSRLNPAKALILQAIGTERIESLCDTFEDGIKREKGYCLTSRFSPGYGDLPLEVQTDVFKALDCYKNIGVTLNESLLMSPSKTVTAIIGIQG